MFGSKRVPNTLNLGPQSTTWSTLGPQQRPFRWPESLGISGPRMDGEVKKMDGNQQLRNLSSMMVDGEENDSYCVRRLSTDDAIIPPGKQ